MQFASEYAYVKEEALKKKRNEQAKTPEGEETTTTTEEKKVKFADAKPEDEEEFDEEELREGIRTHSINSTTVTQPKPRSTTSATHKFRRIDTNVFRVDLSTLSQEAYTATGDPIFCEECKAVFSSISKVEGLENPNVPSIRIETPEDTEKEKELECDTKGKEKETKGNEGEKEGDSQEWYCEFCGHQNKIHIESEELPQANTMDFVLSVPETSASSIEESNVIFCVDTSGSMCVTTEIRGRVQLKLGAEKMASLQRSLNPEGGQQYMPGWNRNVTYISRMQCVQAAVGAQLDLLSKDHPSKRVGLVSFSNDVLITGDGKQEAKVVAGDKLNEFDTLLALSSELTLERPISETKDALVNKLNSLEESGATALGPALLASVVMASKKPGSKVILCTDGLANVGLGSMESEAEMETAQEFYTRVANFAKDNGVIINVISIKGTTCSMEILGLLADTTSGEVDIVDPLLLTTNFHSILAIPVLAVHVKATVLLHKGLFLRDEDDNIHEQRLDKEIGSVTKESSLTLEYGVKGELDEGITSLPFQVQIHYTRMDGTQMVRVVSYARPITTKREEAEQKMDRKVLGLNSIKKSARYARSGDYESARLHSYSTTRLMSRNINDNQSRSDYNSYVNAYEVLDSELLQATKEEESEGNSYSLNSANNFGYSASREEKKTMRKMARAKSKDSTSKTLYKFSSAGYSVFDDDLTDSIPDIITPPPSTALPSPSFLSATISTTTTSTSTSTSTTAPASCNDSLPCFISVEKDSSETPVDAQEEKKEATPEPTQEN